MSPIDLQFDEESHTYSVNGVRWPSVTQILEPLMLLDGIPQQVLDAAAEFGRHVHLAVHLFNIGRLDEQDLDENLRPYLEGWKQFLFDTGARVLSSEQRLCHPVLHIAGQLDDEIVFDKSQSVSHVLDVKTGCEVPWTVGPQTSAYLEMLSLEKKRYPADRVLSKVRFCCHLLGNRRYSLITLKDHRRDWNDFVSALNFHRMRTERGRRASKNNR